MLLDAALQEVLQWLTITGGGLAVMFGLGKKAQKIDELEQQVETVEMRANEAIQETVKNGKALAELKTKADLTYDLLKEIRDRVGAS